MDQSQAKFMPSVVPPTGLPLDLSPPGRASQPCLVFSYTHVSPYETVPSLTTTSSYLTSALPRGNLTVAAGGSMFLGMGFT